MMMTRRLALLLAAVLLPALLGSFWIQLLSAREALMLQQNLRNQDAAIALASSLAQRSGHLAALRAAPCEPSICSRLRLVAGDGSLILERVQPPQPSPTPTWFVETFALPASPGRAIVEGDGAPAQLLLELQSTWAQDMLWSTASTAAVLLGLLGLLAAAMVTWLMRRWRQALRGIVAQVRALGDGRAGVTSDPLLSDLPELGELMRSMNAMVKQLREMFDAQAAQVGLLQRQAHTDAVTGLPQRRQFVGRLGDRLGDVAAPACTLLLVRLIQLDSVNERLGFDATDRLLAATADLLQAYVDRVPGACAGRLNGSDFGLLLPVTGVGAETAASLSAAIGAS
ncbi:MAG: diguanylate cyclase, partial [Chitinophagaceae bacterium]|nr:diguanylate cyclase [Rubrivivax sp.]